jgi:hypothetical protein
MITAEEIRKKSENLYVEYLRSIIIEETFFPKVIRSDKSVSSDFNEMRKELENVIKHSKDRKEFGYTIVYDEKPTNTRKHGIQSSIKEINFQTEIDFLKYIHKEKEVAEFRTNCSLILSKFSELKEWICKHPNKVIENQNQWDDILKVCHYFKQKPINNDLYIRELPIEVHTKFIKNNEGIIRELLNILIKDYVQQNEKDFEKCFNLKCIEPLIRFRILDKQISQNYFYGIDDLSIPISQFEQLKLPLINVFVVENKTNLLTIALTLPKIEKTIVIFGSGYKVENLKNVKWLEQVKLFYWGDLDVHGFEILSQFRGYFRNVKSFLMDKDTFNKFFENDSGMSSKVIAKNLTDDEKQLYELLKNNNWRLEQEKIRLEYVKKSIEMSLAL